MVDKLDEFKQEYKKYINSSEGKAWMKRMVKSWPTQGQVNRARLKFIKSFDDISAKDALKSLREILIDLERKKWSGKFDKQTEVDIEQLKKEILHQERRDSEIQFKKSASSKIKSKSNKLFTDKQIAIAYFLLEERITEDNAEDILKKYSENLSVEKLLQVRITNRKDLVKSRDDKAANTKHYKSLIRAKELISSKKDKAALSKINDVIADFEQKRANPE